MTVKEVITQLQNIVDERGDMPCTIDFTNIFEKHYDNREIYMIVAYGPELTGHPWECVVSPICLPGDYGYDEGMYDDDFGEMPGEDDEGSTEVDGE
jgi:hypothetical protein